MALTTVTIGADDCLLIQRTDVIKLITQFFSAIFNTANPHIIYSLIFGVPPLGGHAPSKRFAAMEGMQHTANIVFQARMCSRRLLEIEKIRSKYQGDSSSNYYYDSTDPDHGKNKNTLSLSINETRQRKYSEEVNNTVTVNSGDCIQDRVRRAMELTAATLTRNYAVIHQDKLRERDTDIR